MNNIELFIKIIVFIILSLFLLLCLKKIWRGKTAIQFYFYLIYYIFFVAPLIFQLIFSDHSYTSFVRADEAMSNPLANLIYDIFCLALGLVIYISGVKTKNRKLELLKYNRSVIYVCYAIMVLVFLYTVLTNNPLNLLTYGSSYKGLANVNESLTGMGTICFLVILSQKKAITSFTLSGKDTETRIKIRKKKAVSNFIFYTSIFLVFAFCWFVGKRYIVAETLMVSFVVLGMSNQISGKKFMIMSVAGFAAILVFCVVYAIVLKGNFSSLTDYLMVDFSRQYTLVYQFHCFLTNKSISVHRFDAVLYLLLFWIPRAVWPTRPYPFVNQLTYSLISWYDTPSGENVGWATTCSVFSDLFDSFRFVGLILGFLLFMYLFRCINRSNKLYFKTILLYLLIRLATVQISSAIVPIVVCFIMIALAHIASKKLKLFSRKGKKKYAKHAYCTR